MIQRQDTAAVLLPMNFKISSIRITGKEKASTRIQSWSVKGTTPKIVARAGMYKMKKWLPERIHITW